MVKLSIVIVNYNAGDFLATCLKSLEKVKEEVKFETWLVDNDSTDGSFEDAKKNFKIKIIKNEKNIGFGSANNIVLRQIKTEYILLLNPDSEVLPGTLKYMIQFMDENKDVGVATCRVEKEDGSLDLASHRGFPTPWASFLHFALKDDSIYHLTRSDMTKPHEIDAVAGAFFLTRKLVLDKVGLFDEDYFMYAEDIDLCFRIKQKGFKVMFVPEIKIIHHKGISSGLKKHTQHLTTATPETRQKMTGYFYSTMKIFYKKHYAKNNLFLVNWLVYLGINLKWWLAKRKLTV